MALVSEQREAAKTSTDREHRAEDAGHALGLSVGVMARGAAARAVLHGLLTAVALAGAAAGAETASDDGQAPGQAPRKAHASNIHTVFLTECRCVGDRCALSCASAAACSPTPARRRSLSHLTAYVLLA